MSADESPSVSRRSLLVGATAMAATVAANPQAQAADDANWKVEKGRINQSVVSWCFNPMPVEELAQGAAAMGLKSVELCDPKLWPKLKTLGLTCAIASTHGFVKGWNHKENWDFCREKMTTVI